MFRVEVFVDDNKMPKLLHAMTGLILGDPKVQPVANGTVKKGQPIAANNGEFDVMFRDYVKKQKLTEIDASAVKGFIASIGGATSSYSHFIDKLKKLGVLKKKTTRGNANIYSVVNK